MSRINPSDSSASTAGNNSSTEATAVQQVVVKMSSKLLSTKALQAVEKMTNHIDQHIKVKFAHVQEQKER